MARRVTAYTNVVVVVGNTNNGTVTGLVAGTTYYFAATSYDGSGTESTFSDEVSYTVPGSAPQLRAVVSSGGQFSFTVSGITGQIVADYKIYYGAASHTYTNVVVLVGNTNNGTVTGLVAGTTYYFAATSYDGAGTESPFSDEVSYTVPQPAAQLRALVSSGGQFSFTVLGTTGQTYVVQASTNLLDWVSVLSNTAPFVFVDSNTAGFNQRFYRAFSF